jgi:CBS domain-containing protein
VKTPAIRDINLQERKVKSVPNLGEFLKMRVRLHYTWSVAFLLSIAIMVTQFPETYPLWQRIILGLCEGLLFLAVISIRQFALGFLALRRHIPARRVTLFVFGGVSHLTKQTSLPIVEQLMALAGLMSNFILVGIIYVVYLILVGTGNVVIVELIQWLAFIVLMLALFHFLPGFPLDGGRLLRAIIWRASGDFDRATRIANRFGEAIGWLVILGGVAILIITRQWHVGLMLAFVGWVLRSAAAQSRRQTVLLEALQNITAREIISKECPLINKELTIYQLVQGCVLVTGQRNFVIVDDAKLHGIVTMRDIRAIPKKRWESTCVGEIMTPAIEFKVADSNQSAASLLEQMDESGTSLMPVLENEKVIGIVVRDSLVRLGKTRAELGI